MKWSTIKRKLFISAATLLLAGGAVSCSDDTPTGEPVTHSEASSALRVNLESNLVAATDSLRFVDSMQVVTTSFDYSEVLIDGASGDTATDPSFPDPDPFPEEEPVGGGGRLGEETHAEANDLVNEMIQSFLVEQYIESSTQTSLTYRLPDPCEGDTAECTDPQIRFIVTSPSTGNVNVSVRGGAARVELGLLEIHQDNIAAEIDFDGYESALGLEGLSASGRIRLELGRTAPGQFEASFSILRAVSFNYQDDFSLTIAEAKDALTAQLDGNGSVLTVTAAFNAIDLMVSGDTFGSETCSASSDGEFFCESTPGPFGKLDVHLAGLTGGVTLDGNSDTLSLTGLGLGSGALTAKADGKEILSVDLNASSGRTFDATLTHDGERLNIAIDPSFELVAALAFSNLTDASEYGAWMRNDTLRVALTGDAPKIAIFDGGAEVLSGALELVSAAFTLNASAGECIAEAEGVVSETDHPFEILAVGACP